MVSHIGVLALGRSDLGHGFRYSHSIAQASVTEHRNSENIRHNLAVSQQPAVDMASSRHSVHSSAFT